MCRVQDTKVLKQIGLYKMLVRSHPSLGKGSGALWFGEIIDIWGTKGSNFQGRKNCSFLKNLLLFVKYNISFNMFNTYVQHVCSFYVFNTCALFNMLNMC